MSSTVTKTFSENKTVGQVCEVRCIECNRETKHEVLASIRVDGSEEFNETFEVSWFDEYEIIRCKGCEAVSFRHEHWFSEDYSEEAPNELLYPKRGEGTLSPRRLPNVPTRLRRIYNETIDCYNNENITLCAAGLRAIVEGICEDRKVSDGPVHEPTPADPAKIVRRSNLQGRISGLEERGVLTKESSETLHAHRFLGNDAIHQLDQPSVEELRLAFEIVEHTLEQIYEMPAKGQKLALFRKSRRASQTVSTDN